MYVDQNAHRDSPIQKHAREKRQNDVWWNERTMPDGVVMIVKSRSGNTRQICRQIQRNGAVSIAKNDENFANRNIDYTLQLLRRHVNNGGARTKRQIKNGGYRPPERVQPRLSGLCAARDPRFPETGATDLFPLVFSESTKPTKYFRFSISEDALLPANNGYIRLNFATSRSHASAGIVYSLIVCSLSVFGITKSFAYYKQTNKQ
jgi:hypothetical protein